VALGAASAGCSSASGANPDSGTAADTAGSTGGNSGTGGTAGTGGAGAAESAVGTFLLTMTAPQAAADGKAAVPGATTILGTLSDGPTPPLAGTKVAASDGSCQLLTPATPFCATPCGSAVCVANDVCQSYPNVKNAGTVTLGGVTCSAGSSAVELKNIAGNYQLPAGVSCSYPGFAEGDKLVLSLSGGDVGTVALDTSGIAPLTLTNAGLSLASNQALTLTWPAAHDPKASHVHVKLDISHHGGSRGAVICDSDDTGSVTLSGTLMTKLLALGIAGFPTIIVTRTATGAASTSLGRVEFVVSSAVERAVEIAGLVSCTSDDVCAPLGKTCQSDLTCK